MENLIWFLLLMTFIGAFGVAACIAEYIANKLTGRK